ncbi:MAG: hypothetical protein FWD57_15480, partial [Polyangiaceae bacterium]|nr:hypothetical protein [Polyangiaceae bacterium]
IASVSPSVPLGPKRNAMSTESVVSQQPDKASTTAGDNPLAAIPLRITSSTPMCRAFARSILATRSTSAGMSCDSSGTHPSGNTAGGWDAHPRSNPIHNAGIS